MKVSRNWLQNFFTDPLPATDAIADALTFHAFEIDGIDPIREPSASNGAGKVVDEVLDVKVTPNRGHDCLSHRGIAAELSAILKLPLDIEKDPFAKQPDLSKKAENVSVSLDTPLAKRYIAGVIRGVKVGPSPKWLVQALAAMGQKSINNVVDATNMVMFNTGQPLHAFDVAKLKTKDNRLKIDVRSARQGEKIVALDEKEYTLAEAMLVIADANADTAIGIAGVKGGMPAAVTEDTTDIIIESANFDGASVRKTAQALKLRTDASSRFEQAISPELAAYGMHQVSALIVAIAGGEVAGFVDVYPEPQRNAPVSVSLEKINRVLGVELSPAEVADVFVRLNLPYKEEHGVFTVVPPFMRLDLEIPEDLIEEVARIIGYDRIPATELPPPEKPALVNPTFYAAEKLREQLVAEGYSEVFTSVFAERGERAVANKIGGDRPYLRSSLLSGLEEALAKNIPQKDLLGLKEVKLFEIGTVWKGGQELVMLGTVTEKEKATEKALAPLPAERYDDLPLSAAVRYQSFSKYPHVSRDIALWVPEGVAAADIEEVIRTNAGDLLARVTLFDEYKKEGRTSYAFRLVFQSYEKTLTDEETNAVMSNVVSAVAKRGWEVR